MTTNFLEKFFEHNHWANLQIIHVCLTLSDEQLDAEPKSATYGSIRNTLLHYLTSQLDYLRMLTLPVEERAEIDTPNVTFDEIEAAAIYSGEAFIALARDTSRIFGETHIQQPDGYIVEPWAIILQAINHADEHREQIKSMLTALGVTPPRIDGWTYARLAEAVIPPTS
ncbi:MAG: DinB family protein [Chloroflexota bacterium]